RLDRRRRRLRVDANESGSSGRPAHQTRARSRGEASEAIAASKVARRTMTLSEGDRAEGVDNACVAAKADVVTKKKKTRNLESTPPNGGRKLFGTDGVRGAANEPPMTPEMALRLGRA